MHFNRLGYSIAAFGFALAFFGSPDAEAAGYSRHGASRSASYGAGSRDTVRAVRSGMGRYAAYRSGGSYGRLQCVPFARENTGIELSGNAAAWWGAADGVYARGARPEIGSILNFRATGRMRMGHVAVVSNVVDGRTIEIDHANWPGGGRGGISRAMQVVDVSERNDWTAVRVELGRGGDFGSTYPTYGFIYDRADNGLMLANSGGVTRQATTMGAAMRLAAAPAEAVEIEEVAEAADDAAPRYGRSRAATRRVVRNGRALAERAPAGRVVKASVHQVSAQPAAKAHARPAHAGRHRL